jgi:hypothetical protein
MRHTRAVDPRDDRVLGTTRWLSAFITPFLLVAFVVLFFWAGDTDRLFAWTLRPELSAMVLGSVYLGGAYFFLRAVRATQWHTIKAGFIPVTVFASLMGVATILHWDRFNHSHVAFWLWAGLYFTTPFLVLATWLRNRPYDDPGDGTELEIGRLPRVCIAGLGVLAAATSAFLFLDPHRAISEWPWTLTTLSARVMAAILALGIGGLAVLTDVRWSAVRIMVEVQGVMLLLVLLSGVRARGELDSSNRLTWLFLIGFTAMVVGGVVIHLAMQRRQANSAAVGH